MQLGKDEAEGEPRCPPRHVIEEARKKNPAEIAYSRAPELQEPAAVAQLGTRSSATNAQKSGRMVARKNDPVWLAISEFGCPYPPFKLGSDMGVMDVDYEEAIDLKIIKRNEKSVALEPRIAKATPLPDKFSAKMRSMLKPELLNCLEQPIGQEALVIERLALVPPMTRLVVTDYFTRSWAEGQMKFSMGYIAMRSRECASLFEKGPDSLAS